jgi:hypothetical protein
MFILNPGVGVEVSVIAINSRFAGSNPTENDGIFKSDKNP